MLWIISSKNCQTKKQPHNVAGNVVRTAELYVKYGGATGTATLRNFKLFKHWDICKLLLLQVRYY